VGKYKHSSYKHKIKEKMKFWQKEREKLRKNGRKEEKGTAMDNNVSSDEMRFEVLTAVKMSLLVFWVT
jgi:hypothetical protein